MERILKLQAECKKYLDENKRPEIVDIFCPVYNAYNLHSVAYHFFDDVIYCYGVNPEFMQKCLDASDLSGTAIDVYSRLNVGRGAFRDALILVSHETLETHVEIRLLEKMEFDKKQRLKV